jgi:hypothetical protein
MKIQVMNQYWEASQKGDILVAEKLSKEINQWNKKQVRVSATKVADKSTSVFKSCWFRHIAIRGMIVL